MRDLVYSFIAPGERDCIIYCGKQESLPRRICREEPFNFGVLWASKAVQYEFLERFCALHTFIFTFPKASEKSTTSVKPLSQEHMDLIQSIEIHMDLADRVSPALSMLSRGKSNRRLCRVILSNESGKIFGPIHLDVSPLMRELRAFETVIVKYEYKQQSIFGNRPRWCVEEVLGPGRGYLEGKTVCHEFHPRQSLALNCHHQDRTLYVDFDWLESDSFKGVR